MLYHNKRKKYIEFIIIKDDFNRYIKFASIKMKNIGKVKSQKLHKIH